MELSIKIDGDQLKELVDEAAAHIKEEMCFNCPYKEVEDESKCKDSERGIRS